MMLWWNVWHKGRAESLGRELVNESLSLTIWLLKCCTIANNFFSLLHFFGTALFFHLGSPCVVCWVLGLWQMVVVDCKAVGPGFTRPLPCHMPHVCPPVRDVWQCVSLHAPIIVQAEQPFGFKGEVCHFSVLTCSSPRVKQDVMRKRTLFYTWG